MKFLFIILIIVCLTLVIGCSKENKLANMKDCQEGCLSKNMSFNSFTSFKSDNNTFLKCNCDFYLGVG
jgi:outer membrane lipoprotein-sorting protein